MPAENQGDKQPLVLFTGFFCFLPTCQLSIPQAEVVRCLGQGPSFFWDSTAKQVPHPSPGFLASTTQTQITCDGSVILSTANEAELWSVMTTEPLMQHLIELQEIRPPCRASRLARGHSCTFVPPVCKPLYETSLRTDFSKH